MYKKKKIKESNQHRKFNFFQYKNQIHFIYTIQPTINLKSKTENNSQVDLLLISLLPMRLMTLTIEM